MAILKRSLGALALTFILSSGSSAIAEQSAGLDGFTIINNAAISGHNDRKGVSGTPADCARACETETAFVCKSFDYDKQAKKCDLSASSRTEVGGLKTDYVGNPYDHYERVLQSNNVITPTGFRLTEGAAISGYNTKRISGSPTECAKACLSETAFECRSFDFHKGKNICDLSDKAAESIGGLKSDYPGNPYDHYSRIYKIIHNQQIIQFDSQDNADPKQQGDFKGDIKGQEDIKIDPNNLKNNFPDTKIEDHLKQSDGKTPLPDGQSDLKANNLKNDD